jgi:hypothetical protein
VNGAAYKSDQLALQKYIQQSISNPFDLSADYMLRASLISFDEQEHLLVFTIHHIASDAWSIPIIVEEVVELYAANVEDRRYNYHYLSCNMPTMQSGNAITCNRTIRTKNYNTGNINWTGQHPCNYLLIIKGLRERLPWRFNKWYYRQGDFKATTCVKPQRGEHHLYDVAGCI